MKEIVAVLRGWISGPAVPFVVDGTGGLGKMPVSTTYLQLEGRTGGVWATNYQGRSARQQYLENQ